MPVKSCVTATAFVADEGFPARVWSPVHIIINTLLLTGVFAYRRLGFRRTRQKGGKAYQNGYDQKRFAYGITHFISPVIYQLVMPGSGGVFHFIMAITFIRS